MTTLTKQYLDSGTYEVTLEEATDADTTSYVYTRFGTFRIVPIVANPASFESLQNYSVYLDKVLIGECYVNSIDNTFSSAVGYAMATAIDIVNNKLIELIDEEERKILSDICNDILSSINLTEEQKAMYRTFLIEQGTLDDVIQEMKTPTDVFGDKT